MKRKYDDDEKGRKEKKGKKYISSNNNRLVKRTHGEWLCQTPLWFSTYNSIM